MRRITPPFCDLLCNMSKILIILICFYQKYLSRFFEGACIYSPTCSRYAVEAIKQYGSFKGSKMAMQRLLRCRRPYKGGNDPLL